MNSPSRCKLPDPPFFRKKRKPKNAPTVYTAEKRRFSFSGKDSVMSTQKKALLIGGTGTISSSITQRLASNGEWEVALLNRGNRNAGLPANVETITADIADAAAVRRALGAREFDVVANFINFVPAQVQRDIELFSGRTAQYIFISSASAYQKPVTRLPITESTPLHNPFWQYSRDKIACEDVLNAAYRESGFPVTIVRPSHTYSYRTLPLAVNGKNKAWAVLERIRLGKPVLVHGDGTSLWVLTHADDFAVGFTGIMGNSLAVGQAFQITSDDVLTWDGIYGHIAAALGTKPNIFHMTSDAIAKSLPEHGPGLLGDKACSVIFDNTKIRTYVPEFQPRIRFENAVRKIVETFAASPELQTPDPEFDAWCDAALK
jgi:nucleoside-diphosphate-sugar epimerase